MGMVDWGWNLSFLRNMKDALKKPSRACWMEFLWGHPSCSGPPMVSLRSSFSGFIVKISRSGGEVPASRSRMSTLSRQWQDWYLSQSLWRGNLLLAFGDWRFPLMIKSCPVVTLWSNHGQWVLGCGFGCAVTHTQVKSSYCSHECVCYLLYHLLSIGLLYGNDDDSTIMGPLSHQGGKGRRWQIRVKECF